MSLSLPELENIKDFIPFSPAKVFKKDAVLSVLFPFKYQSVYRDILEGAKYKERLSTPQEPFIAGVRFNKSGRLVFEYNPVLMGKLFTSTPHFKSVVIHECLHVMLGHLTYRRSNNYNQGRWNIACDLAINSIINEEHIPDFMIRPGLGEFAHLKKGLSSEKYYKLIKDVPPSKLINRSHLWAHALKHESRYVLEERGSSIEASLHGHAAPSELLEYHVLDTEINMFVKIPKLEHLLYRIVKLHQTGRKATRRVPNKRYSDYPATIKERTPEPVVALVDHSGSIGNDDIKVLYGFLSVLNKTFPITIVPFSENILLDEVVNYPINSLKCAHRKHAGGTNINDSLKSAYEKFGTSKVFIVVSDFRDDKIQVPVTRNTFAVCPKSIFHYLVAHKCFQGREFAL